MHDKADHLPNFVIESRDPTTKCITKSASFAAPPNDVCRIALVNDLTEIQNTPYQISSSQLSELKSHFDFNFSEISNDKLTIRGWHWMDSLPYETHTGRELTMMIRGDKPLAAFSLVTYESKEEDDIFAEERFDEHVAKGLFVKFQNCYVDQSRPNSPIKIRCVYYAQKKEAWRINALIFLRKVTNGVSWNDSFERVESALLGYSKNQIDVYLSLKPSFSALSSR